MQNNMDKDMDVVALILDCCDRIEATYQRIGKSFEVFEADPDFHDSLLMNILQIGEAANRLSDELRERFSFLPWGEMIGTRNIIVHGYVKINDDIIWNIIEKDIPLLKTELEKIFG